MTLFGFPGLQSRSPEFITRIQEVASRLQTDPNWLLTIMQLESGITPDAQNPQGKATGLIQFMPATAKALGTSVDALRSMADYEQLEYVEAFYRKYTGKLRGPGDVYMVTFYPSMAFRDSGTVIAKKGEPVYDQNSGLDTNKDDILTVGDVESKAQNAYSKYASLPAFQAPKVDDSTKNGMALVGVALAVAGGLWALKRRATGRTISSKG